MYQSIRLTKPRTYITYYLFIIFSWNENTIFESQIRVNRSTTLTNLILLSIKNYYIKRSMEKCFFLILLIHFFCWIGLVGKMNELFRRMEKFLSDDLKEPQSVVENVRCLLSNCDTGQIGQFVSVLTWGRNSHST